MLCKICHSDGIRSVGQIPGYILGSTYQVSLCDNCETSGIDPCRGDTKLYDAIYKNISRVPGYSRYHRLTDELLNVRDPLQHLARAEDCYYAVAKTLKDRIVDKRRTAICEVGCGHGYLTYSLVRSGYNCTGIDISPTAVAAARRRFGDHYFCGTIEEFCATASPPDIIIATELLEHLEDPVHFVASLVQVLREQGVLILTTPNKTPHSHKLWDTELPPVHLWWFTKNGLVELAKVAQCSVAFVDMTHFYDENLRYHSIDRNTTSERRPVFDSNYELINLSDVVRPAHRFRSQMKRMLPNSIVRQIQRYRAGAGYGGPIGDANSFSIAALFARVAQ